MILLRDTPQKTHSKLLELRDIESQARAKSLAAHTLLLAVPDRQQQLEVLQMHSRYRTTFLHLTTTAYKCYQERKQLVLCCTSPPLQHSSSLKLVYKLINSKDTHPLD